MHVSNFGISVLFFIDSGKFVSCQLPEAVELQEHKMWVELAWLFIYLFFLFFFMTCWCICLTINASFNTAGEV